MTYPQFVELLKEVLGHSPRRHSILHGEQHWQQVAYIGYYLLTETPQANPLVVLLFSLLHDSQRQGEWQDRAHGQRAATYAKTLQGRYFHLSLEDFSNLEIACSNHEVGTVAFEPTISVCWDADRLNLWRVGTTPLPKYLSTPAARKPVFIDWAQYLIYQKFKWSDLYAKYATLPEFMANKE